MAWVTLCSRKMSNGILVNDYSLELFRIQNRRQRLKSEQSLRLRKLQNEQDEMLKNNAAHIHYDEAVQALKDAQKIDTETPSTTSTENTTPFENIEEFTYDEALKFGYLTNKQKEGYDKIKGSIDTKTSIQKYNRETETLTITTKDGVVYSIGSDGRTTVEYTATTDTTETDIQASYEIVPINEIFKGTEMSIDEIRRNIFNEKQTNAFLEKDENGKRKYAEYALSRGKYDEDTGAVLLQNTRHSDEYLVIEVDGTAYNVTSDGRRYDASIQTHFFRGANEDNYIEKEGNGVTAPILTYNSTQNEMTPAQKTTYERIKKGIKDFDKNTISRYNDDTQEITITEKNGTVHVIDKSGKETVTLSNGNQYTRTAGGKNEKGGVDFSEFIEKLSESQLDEILKMAGVKEVDDLKKQYILNKSKLNGSLFFIDENGNATVVKPDGNVADIEMDSSEKIRAKNSAIAKAEKELDYAKTDWQSEELMIRKMYSDLKEEIEEEINEEENMLARKQADIEAITQILADERDALKQTLPQAIQKSTIFG